MASYGIQVQMYINDEPTGRIFNHWATSSTITAQTLVSAAPSSWRENYDFEGVRNYSSWITYRRGVFTGLSSSKTNYINFSYSEKTVSYWTWGVYYRGNSPSGGTVTGLPSNESGQEVSGTAYRYTIPSTTPKLSDYIFTGWEDQNGNSWSPGSRFTIAEDDPTIYLYAQWLYPSGTVKVVFDEGIASITGACRDSAGNYKEFPSSTYPNPTSPASFSNIHHLWLNTITLKSGYTYPWYASVSGNYYDWSNRTSGSTSSVNNTVYPVNRSTATLTLSATLQPFTWHIYYRDRLGSNHSNWPTNQSGTSTASLVYVTLSDDYPTRTGYNFVEWENNSGTTFNPGDSLSISAEEPEIYLYAVWSAHTYTIYFNGNGSTSGTMSNMYNLKYGTSYTLNANVYKKQYTISFDENYEDITPTEITSNYNFSHWYGSDGNTYENKETISNLVSTDGGSFTMSARWTGGSITVPTPKRTNYEFLGWYTASSGGSLVYSGGETIYPTSNKTYYAHWKISAIKPTITYVSHTDITIVVNLNRNGGTNGYWLIQASTSSSFGTIASSVTISNTTTTQVTIPNLTENTTYYIRAKNIVSSVEMISDIITASTRISEFTWTSDDATNIQAGMIFSDNIKASKWIDLGERVNWCRNKKNLSIISFTIPTRNVTKMTKEIFNQMRNAIYPMYTNITSEKESGDTILAKYFANDLASLKAAINSVITTL